jgi:hypothetical protein
MILADGKTVRTGNCVLTWDGLRNPEVRTSGSTSWNISCAFDVGSPELAELEQIANTQLAAGRFKGAFPHGGNWPLGNMVNPDKIPELAGRMQLSFKTSNGVPPLFNAQGQQLDIMQAGGFLYPGCVVQVLADCFDYDNKQKGLSFGILGLMFIDTKAPKLAVGGGMSAAQVAGAFGVQAPTPGPTPGPSAPAPGFAGGPPAAPAAPAGPVMTPAANGVTYAAYIAAGWTDAQLIEHGLLVA